MYIFVFQMKSYVPFGANRTVAQEGDARRHLCYIAFDILMLNDEITMDLTLTRRRAILTHPDHVVFKPKTRYLEYTNMMTGIKDTSGIMQALDNALRDHHEGIIVKRLDSTYQCAKRGNEWIKMKPDYVDDMVSRY